MMLKDLCGQAWWLSQNVFFNAKPKEVKMSFVDRDYWMQVLIEDEPLSVGEIERLGQYSNRYLIPYNQSKSFVYALVINSSQDIQ